MRSHPRPLSIHPGIAWPIAVALALGLGLMPIASESLAASNKQRIERVKKRPPKRAPAVHGSEQDLNEFRAGGLGTVPAPALQAYLNSIAARLMASSGLEPIEVQVHLATDIGFGASVTPDGNIFVDLRLVQRFEDEDAMAGVIAHELAHLLLGHPNRKRLQNRQEQALVLSDLAIRANRAVAKQSNVDVEVTDESTGRDYQDIAYRLNRDVITPGWGRKQELEADELGTDLLAAAGYDPSALLDYLALLADQAADSAGMLDAVVEARADLIGDSLETYVPDSPTTGSLFGDLMVNQARKSMEKRVARQLANLGKTHPDPEKRVEEFMEYLSLDAFLEANTDRRIEPWEAALSDPETRVLLDHYAAAFELQARLGDEDSDALEALARKAVSGPTKGHPFPRLAFSQLRHSQGRAAPAQKNLELAIGGPEPTGRLTTELATLHFEAGDATSGAKLVEAQWARMGEPESLYPLVIKAMLYTGRSADAFLIVQRCGQTSVLGKDCQATYEAVSRELSGGTPSVAAQGPPDTGAALTGSTDETAPSPEQAVSEGLESLKEGLLGGWGRKK